MMVEPQVAVTIYGSTIGTCYVICVKNQNKARIVRRGEPESPPGLQNALFAFVYLHGSRHPKGAVALPGAGNSSLMLSLLDAT